jgi:hypothetical protein
MAWSTQSASGLRTAFSLLLVAALIVPSQALYFFMDGPSQKCFFEELPKDTLVVGESSLTATLLTILFLDPQLGRSYGGSCNARWHPLGHFNAEQWDESTRSYQPSSTLGVFITVEEVFDNDHRVVAQRGAAKGRFTFSAADSGEHRLCFTPTGAASHSGWLTNGQPAGGIKLQLDLAIGETSKIESTDKGKIEDIVQKVRDLNGRLQDIRREQIFQRVC